MFDSNPEFVELIERLQKDFEAERAKKADEVFGLLGAFGFTEDRLQQIGSFAGLARKGIEIEVEREGSEIVVRLSLIHLDETVHRSWQIRSTDEPRDLSDEVLDEVWVQMKPRWREIDKLLEAAIGIVTMHAIAETRSLLN
ncbi:hypothetical protein [Roseibium aggregatum]|uniref:Uncharacterized protein n=1 Tax=Roseibium aggregatum TaxID=187304 RepID=A0A0M6YDZ3_9HYPH|nr:hypothetical protein [Roseibium aggregatum]CTQ47723.1 hypothetical protein LAL4801_06192 [Roseibium aggregatum]